MPDFRAIALPAFTDNYVWLLADGKDRVVVVDPGDATPVLRAAADGLAPQAILVTHHHDDHVAGVAALMDAFDIPCHAPTDARIAHARHRVVDGDCVRIPSMDLDFAVIGVPGHTRSHVAYHGGGHLFCGDALFSLGCGRMFEGTAARMLASLDRMASLPGDTAVCCAHEYTLANGAFAVVVEQDNNDRDAWLATSRERLAHNLPSLPSCIGIERAANPFLRCDSPGVMASLAARLGRPPRDRIEAFATLRSWKDGFRP